MEHKRSMMVKSETAGSLTHGAIEVGGGLGAGVPDEHATLIR